MHPTVVENTKVKASERVARTFHTIVADSKGNLPTRIEVLKVGMWDTPYHGIFMITPEDCQQMVENFDAGIAMPGGAISAGGVGLPIDLGHKSDELAAGWMKGLVFEDGTLYADPVEWTTAGKDALLGGNYKCFSPEFYPGSRGGWENPEVYDQFIANVLVGGGLTNIPLFKGLKPIMASTSNKEKDGEAHRNNVIYISASNNVKENTMQLEQVRAKSADTLTEEEKTFIVEHKEELTSDEKTKFGLETQAPAPAPVKTDDENKGTEGDPAKVENELEPAVAAAIKNGEKVVVDKGVLASLQNTQRKYETEAAEKIVASHVTRGAIVASEKDKWITRLVSASETDRKEFEDMLSKLPNNQIVASEIGKTGEEAAGKAVDELHQKTTEALKASNGSMNYTQAQAQVLASNADLNTRVNKEREEE